MIKKRKAITIVGVILAVPVLLLLYLLSDFFTRTQINYKSDELISPSGEYYFVNTVNRQNKKSEDYARVVLNIFNKKNELIGEFNTNCGDAMKWTSGWDINSDTVIMDCNDNGRTYITKSPFKELEISTE